MKKFTLLAATLFIFAAVQAQTATPETKPVVAEVQEVKDITKFLTFKNDNYNFGKIPQGKPVEFDLEITNISKDSIRIENVQVGCGCTTPRYEKIAYAPGQSFKVTLGYNAASLGATTKTATIYFSGGLTKTVSFAVETFAAPENAAPKNEAGKIKPGN